MLRQRNRSRITTNDDGRKQLPNHPLVIEILDVFKDTESIKLKDPEEISPLQNRFRHQKLQRHINNGCELTEATYTEILEMLVLIEDAFVCKSVEQYQPKKQKALIVPQKPKENNKKKRVILDEKYKCILRNASKIPSEIQEGDSIILSTPNMFIRNYQDKTPIYCRIRKIQGKTIEFSPNEDNHKIVHCRLYDLKFEKDRTATRMQLEALKNMEIKVIQNTLFPKEASIVATTQKENSFDWVSNLCGEQKQAVVQMVDGSAYPTPYILFGPPGTGKTTTLAEAITQICKLKPDSRILVTASTNAACDEIALKLLSLSCIPDEDIYRFYANSQLQKADEINKNMKRISNLDSKKYDLELSKIKKFKVIICTLVMCGRMALRGLKKGFFDYIFIDEAGSATEPLALIPLQAFISDYNCNKITNVILAGDPKQLGPVLMCKQAEMLGLGQSLLERLMNLEMYKPGSSTGEYNITVLTHLIQNFRSYADILEVPSELFYDGKLLARASLVQTILAINWKLLSNPSVPIIFNAIKGETESDQFSFSLSNQQEVCEVLYYLKIILTDGINGRKIDPKEIGIISPYKKQCELLKREIRGHKNGKDITVDTVEKFQGQERKIIIVSTVRSRMNTIGFLNDPKRLNVTLTRAKCLLIVIGNPNTLQRDKNWAAFVQYCKVRGAYCEKPIRDDIQKALKQFRVYCSSTRDELFPNNCFEEIPKKESQNKKTGSGRRHSKKNSKTTPESLDSTKQKSLNNESSTKDSTKKDFNHELNLLVEKMKIDIQEARKNKLL